MDKTGLQSFAGESISIEPASRNDLPDLLTLLERSDLPKDGITNHVATALVARKANLIVGSAALELYGAEALLRSVTVDEPLRGQGIGRKLTDAALELARRHKIKTVFLLTETASQFFLRFGFRQVSRSQVPDTVKRSVEFTSACRTGAQVMARHLEKVNMRRSV